MKSTLDNEGFEQQGKIRRWKMVLPPNLPPKNSRHVARIREKATAKTCSRIFQKEQRRQFLPGNCTVFDVNSLEVIPIGKTSWWGGVKSGRFPKPVKLSERCTAWKAGDIRDLIKRLSEQPRSHN
jgi:prophage regulatory protein